MNNYILSTAYWPSITYCRNLLRGPVVIDIGEHFVKQSHRSRCEILGPNGKQQLIVPVQKHRNKTITGDIRISYEQPWRKLQWKSLEAAYRSSPYFEYYEDDLKKLMLKIELEYLWELNREILDFIKRKLHLHFDLSYSHTYIEKSDHIEDLRNIRLQPENLKSYIQVFSDRHDFIADLSLLDLICNEGPNSITYLK